MIEPGCTPACRRVTVFASIAGRDVVGALAGRGHAVVARRARAGNRPVIHTRGGPACCRMAIVTGIGRRNVA